MPRAEPGVGVRDRRPRIGLLVPSSNTTMETDFHRALGAHASLHASRMYLVETTRKAEIEMVKNHAPRAAADLGTLHPDVVVFGCTSAGSLFGPRYDRELCEDLGRLAAAPCIGMQTAVQAALDRTGGMRLAVLAPYVDELTRSTAESLAAGSRELVAAAGMGIKDNSALADSTPEDIVAFARNRLAGAQFDVLFVSCANFRALEAKPHLEMVFGVPVVTSNSAAIDAVRAKIGVTLSDEELRARRESEESVHG